MLELIEISNTNQLPKNTKHFVVFSEGEKNPDMVAAACKTEKGYFLKRTYGQRESREYFFPYYGEVNDG